MHPYMKIFNYCKLLCHALPLDKWKNVLLCFQTVILIMIATFGRTLDNRISIPGLVQRNSFVHDYGSIPCIEPHCNIQCFNTYGYDIIVRSESLLKIQQQHLMIDMGNDVLVNDLINFIPPPKSCSYGEDQTSLSKIYSNKSVEFYPIVFGFVDHYLMRGTTREVLFNEKIHIINEICLPKKTKDFSELIPGRPDTYKFTFENELDYRRLYTAAYYAITKKKGGWDCNRHYEIISSGTIPYFEKLKEAGIHTMSHLPKSLLYEAHLLAGIDYRNLTINHALFDIDQYNLILHRLLYYAKHRLTTVKIVEYILKVIQYPLKSSRKHSVLYIGHDKCDYMKEFMLHGFTRIFEENLHVFQPPEYLYYYPAFKMWTNQETKAYYGQKLYGLGFGYKLVLKDYVHLYERDKRELFNEDIVQKNIENKIYSLIVFGSILRQNRLFSFATRHYDRSKIIAIDGEDEGKDIRRSEYAKHAYYFLREIPDDCDKFM